MFHTENPQIENPISRLPESIQHIAQSLRDEKDFKPSQVIRVLKEAQVTQEELAPWADYDHPVTDSYGRKLVYDGGHFEIMVMSWRPGDFSAIHDHGHTQWGAVQIFGPAEHATFRVEDGSISTLARWTVTPGDIVGVGHSLVHQMGNPTENQLFVSLHVYGSLSSTENITGDARVFDLQNSTIQRVDGGVFFALPENEIKRVESGPEADFPTRIRHMTELIRRLRTIRLHKPGAQGPDIDAIVSDTFSTDRYHDLVECLDQQTDPERHQQNSTYWRALNWDLRRAADLQNELVGQQNQEDHFHRYAQLYDAVIGRPCLKKFIGPYLKFARDHYQIDFSTKKVISIGCGTALVGKYLKDELKVPHVNLYGIDISEAMVIEARKRIDADVGDVLTLDPALGLWDLAISTLNVLHYVNYDRLEEAIQKTAAIIKPGGFFIGDFITPDHIRWYPNVMYSDDRRIVSLRTPRLIESDGLMFQESEIVNVDATGEQIDISYAGKHRRFLPPLHRMRTYFEKAFDGQVEIFDAVSLTPVKETADSCTSTRYLVVARRNRD